MQYSIEKLENSQASSQKKFLNDGELNACYEDLQTSKVSIFDLTNQEKLHLQNVFCLFKKAYNQT